VQAQRHAGADQLRGREAVDAEGLLPRGGLLAGVDVGHARDGGGAQHARAARISKGREGLGDGGVVGAEAQLGGQDLERDAVGLEQRAEAGPDVARGADDQHVGAAAHGLRVGDTDVVRGWDWVCTQARMQIW